MSSKTLFPTSAHRVALLVAALAFAACAGDSSQDPSDWGDGEDDQADGTLLVLSTDEGGNAVVQTVPLKIGDKRAMLAEREAIDSGDSDVGVTRQGLYLRSNPCPGSALWLYDRANGWSAGSGATMLCVDNTREGFNDFCSSTVKSLVPWMCGGIKAIWAGSLAGDLSNSNSQNFCNGGTASTCATWAANDAAKNISCGTSYRYMHAGCPGTNGASCTSSNTCGSGLVCAKIGGYSGTCISPRGSTKAPANDHNKCVSSSVITTLDHMDTFASTQVAYGAYEGTVLPPDEKAFPDLAITIDHVQGFSRIPGSSGENWMVGTMSNDGGRGGLFFVKAGALSGNNGEAFSPTTSTNTTTNRNSAYFEIPTEHPGGLQVIGRTVATVGCDTTYSPCRPAVWFFDASNPTEVSSTSAALIRKVSLQMTYPSGTPKPGTDLTSVAVVLLSSGRYLMAVHGTGRYMWLYLSDSDRITSSTQWYFHNYVTYSLTYGPENINFVTECGGDVHLLLTSNPKETLGENGVENYVSTLKLVTSGGKLSFTSNGGYSRGHFYNDDYCYFRAAADFYVTPSGKLLLYCASRSVLTEAGNYKFAQYQVP
jgi:hypothetical protein